MSGVILNMIVKDEAHCILKCLDSLIGFIDGFHIVDTGSSDGTQDVIVGWARRNNIPGEVYDRPWVNFAHNRNEALALATLACPDDYIFFIDADEHIDRAPASWHTPSGFDGYYLNVDYAGLKYQRLALIKADRPWKWVGVVHEYITMTGAKTSSFVAPTIIVEHAGARSRDPDTYKKDAELLLKEHLDNPKDTRTVFYLAQSYKDAGDRRQALNYYIRRAHMGGWKQEVFWSFYQAGLLAHSLGDERSQSAYYFQRAYEEDSRRSEPLLELSKYHRERQEYNLAVLFAKEACGCALMGPPKDGLFIDASAYTWRPYDELATSAFYTRKREEVGRSAAVLAAKLRPDDARIQKNLSFYEEPGDE